MKPEVSGLLILCIVLAAVTYLAYPFVDREISFYDEGIYVVNAKSLATGYGYRTISLPESPSQGKYPPVLPFMLSLIWRVFPNFPENLPVMKGFILAAGLIFLLVTYQYLKKTMRMDGFEAVGVVAIVGLHPFFLMFSTLLASEIPYALLSLLAIWLYERFLAEGKMTSLVFTLVLGAVAFFTRTFGIVLLAAIIVHLLLSRRFRLAAVCTIFTAAIVLPWMVWSSVTLAAYKSLPLDIRVNYTGYGDFSANLLSDDGLATVPLILLWNLSWLVQGWGGFLIPWQIRPLSVLIAVIGFYPLRRALATNPRLQDLYLAFSLLLYLIWPGPFESRLLVVVSPFLVYYCFVGLKTILKRQLIKRWPEETAIKAARIVVAGFVVFSLVGEGLNSLSLREAREKDAPVVYREFHRTLDWIKENSTTDEVLVGAYDPAYHLYSGRKAVRLSFPDPLRIYYTRDVASEFSNAADLLKWFNQINACYILDDPMIGGPERLYYRKLIEALKRASANSLSPVYSGGNGTFVVYKISGCSDKTN